MLREYALLVRWHALRLRFVLPLILVVQTLLAVGIVLGFAFLVPHLDGATALYLATGAPTVTLLTVGLAVVPQMIGDAKAEGSFDYGRTLPVSRLAYLLADATVWLLTVLPGMVAALTVAAARFDLHFAVSPLVVPAFALVALTATAIGSAYAYVLDPARSRLVSQVMVFFVLLFSPISFPPSRLPHWLASAHDVLPLHDMGTLLRDTLVTPPGGVDLSVALLPLAWGVGAFALALAALARRG